MLFFAKHSVHLRDDTLRSFLIQVVYHTLQSPSNLFTWGEVETPAGDPSRQRIGTLERILSCCPIAQGGRALPLARRPGPVGHSGYHPYRTIVHSESLQRRTPSLSQELGRSQQQTPVTPPLACWQHRTIGSWEFIWGSSSSSLTRLQRHR